MSTAWFITLFQTIRQWIRNTLGFSWTSHKERGLPEGGLAECAAEGNVAVRTDHKGRLGPAWRFPSDHLPVGCYCGISEEAQFRVVSWNVMSSRFPISNLEGQGLQGSLCWLQYKRNGHGSNCKLRDCVVLVTLSGLLKGGPHQADVVCLQEFTRHVLKKLKPLLSESGWAIVGEDHFDDSLIMYRQKTLRLLHHEIVKPFSILGRGSGTRALRLASFCSVERDGDVFRVVSGKIPGNPSGIHLAEAASWYTELDPPQGGGPTLFLGDFNFLGEEVEKALSDAGSVGGNGGASLLSSDDGSVCYVTNMSPELVPPGFGGGPLAPKRIDHIVASGRHHCKDLSLIPAAQLLPGIENEVQVLLHSARPHSSLPPRPSSRKPLWEQSTEQILREVNSWQPATPPSKRGRDCDGPPTLW